MVSMASVPRHSDDLEGVEFDREDDGAVTARARRDGDPETLDYCRWERMSSRRSDHVDSDTMSPPIPTYS